MLAGHCDEVGLMGNYISDQGIFIFQLSGELMPILHPGKEVIIHSSHGPVKGIIGKKPYPFDGGKRTAKSG
jgi:endoglucanase